VTVRGGGWGVEVEEEGAGDRIMIMLVPCSGRPRYGEGRGELKRLKALCCI